MTRTACFTLTLATGVLFGCGGDEGDTAFVATLVKTDTAGSKSDSARTGPADRGGLEEDTKLPTKPPVATDDLAKVRAGATASVDVLGNDNDPDGDKLTITKVTQGKLGLVKIESGGYALTYETLDGKATGVDTFTYTCNDGNGGTDTATVTIKVEPPPTLVITGPKDGAKVKPGTVEITFKVVGCAFTYPSADADGCHAHRYLDGEGYKAADGSLKLGQYQQAPFDIGPLKAGKHTFRLVLVKNDGSDQPFSPEIADSIAFEVTQTTGG